MMKPSSSEIDEALNQSAAEAQKFIGVTCMTLVIFVVRVAMRFQGGHEGDSQQSQNVISTL